MGTFCIKCFLSRNIKRVEMKFAIVNTRKIHSIHSQCAPASITRQLKSWTYTGTTNTNTHISEKRQKFLNGQTVTKFVNGTFPQSTGFHLYGIFFKLCGGPHCMGPKRLYSSSARNPFSLENEKLKLYIEDIVEKYDSAISLYSDGQQQPTDSTIYKLGPLVAKYKDYLEKQANLKELQSIISENVDPDMTEMANADLEEISAGMANLEEEILTLIMPVETIDESDVILEVSAGVGGQEAMLFTKEIFNMYSRYAVSRGWQFDIISMDGAEQGGLRKGSASVSGRGVYQYLKYEGGVHRVQRTPKTERSGRIHTSTMAVAVMPLPTDIEVELNPKDLKITTVRSSGAGGQHVNKTESAVRIVHIPTGTVAECQIDRSQFRNREVAMQILRSRLYEKELQKTKQKELTQRKLQVGTSGRSEKVRTFNFPQDRVTDHRLGMSLHHIQGMMAGGEELHDLMEALQGEGQKEALTEHLEQFHRKEIGRKMQEKVKK